MFDLAEYYRTVQNRTMSFTYASAVIFPFYDIPNNLSIEATADNTIQYSDMNDLQRKINHIFYAYRKPNHNMTKDDFDRVITMLSGYASSRPPVGAYYKRSFEELAGAA